MMVAYPVVDLPRCPVGGPRPEQVREEIARWVGSPALSDLVRAFGGTPPAIEPLAAEPVKADPLAAEPLAAALDALERFSQRVWDFRGGGERDDKAPPQLRPDLVAQVRRSAAALGLSGRQLPPADRYDHVLVLGGGTRTALARAHFTAELLREGRVAATEISGLGSFRPLSDRERKAAAEFALPEVTYEADAVGAALVRSFAADPAGPVRQGTTATGERWRVDTYQAGECRLHVLAAPPTRPGERANTADTLVGWADLVAQPATGQRLLVVTTDLFVPFQHCDAVRMLGVGHGCGVDTVGFDSVADQWVSPRSAASVLQEVRSAIRSMQALLQASPPMID